jgi:iron(III) transport system substrate-binding protein
MPGAEPSDIVKAFGEIKPDTLPLADIAANRKKASELVDKVGVNEGPNG